MLREIHEIVREPKSLQAFVEWLPELAPHERYYLSLQVRRKYFPELKSKDRTQLRRFLATKQDMISKINQLECPLGSYLTEEGDILPTSGMALYITLNPRDMRKAVVSSAKALIDLIAKEDSNPHSEVMSQIHKAKSRTTFVHFDIDKPTGTEADAHSPKNATPISDLLLEAEKIVGRKAMTIIETRGGCHLMVDPKKVVSEYKNWHGEIVKKIPCDQTGDLMVPVVGCTQGGFVPRFVL